MGVLTRWHINWTGGGIAGKAATSLHYFVNDNALPQATLDTIAQHLSDGMRDTLRQILPGSAQVGVDPSVLVVDEATGIVLAEKTTGGDTTQRPGQDSGPYSVVSGGVVNLSTSDIVAGRRVRGRVFCVPLGGGAYNQGGTLTNGAVQFLQGFGGVLLGAGGVDNPLMVYSRPRKGAVQRAGSAHLVGAVTASPRVAVLRSRRD